MRRRVWCESLSADNQTAAGSAGAVLHLNFTVGRGWETFLTFGCSRDETHVVFTMVLVRKLLKKSSHLCYIKETCFHHDENIWSRWETSILMRTFQYSEESPGEQGNVYNQWISPWNFSSWWRSSTQLYVVLKQSMLIKMHTFSGSLRTELRTLDEAGSKWLFEFVYSLEAKISTEGYVFLPNQYQ